MLKIALWINKLIYISHVLTMPRVQNAGQPKIKLKSKTGSRHENQCEHDSLDFMSIPSDLAFTTK